jgi:hypothetical protein
LDVIITSFQAEVDAIFLPASALITMDSKIVTSQNLPAGSTVQGTIAAALTNLSDDAERYYKPWEIVWPTREDFELSMPICWSEDLQALLPVATKGI